MLLQQVTPELMVLANEALMRVPRARLDPINTLLQEQSRFDFEQIYAAYHRLRALWAAVTEHRFEEWTSRAPGAAYFEIDRALWHAAAVAKIDQPPDYDWNAGDRLRFDLEELRTLARAYVPG